MSDGQLSSFKMRLQEAHSAGFKADLEAAVLARREVRGGHADWGLLCEEAGLLPLAFREFQLAVRDDVHDAIVHFAWPITIASAATPRGRRRCWSGCSVPARLGKIG